MATFNEFRNSFPESSNDKGERFEIFLSEWMFKHHPALSSQFKEVWRFSEWPGAWSQKDLGTDLIAEDQHGKICAIQAKFYKEKNSIPKSHIDSFLSDSNREGVDYRLLIATTDNLGPNARKTIEGQEKEVQTFLLHHFLEPFEWPESIDSLEDYQPRQPHQPRPHQQAAIDDVCAKIEGRGQLLMACGTGKTLTGQRITEALESKTTLVLLPSLLLLSKTVADWVSEKEKDFIYLPVCSDKSATKKADEISLSNSELCFRSTTDPTEIARFLKRPERKVVFSTYQSSPQIAEAFKTESLKPFDLIIADEAHRCAGKVSSDYSTVLSEDLIPAQKRLFMTATPRTYSSRLKQNAMEAEVQVASMDDEQVFGPVLHHLTFGQAIENDPPLLTDYRVVVVGVNDALVREQVEERAFVRTEGGLEDDARSLAIQIGLSKAIKDYDLKRVISFHGRVNYASDFAASFLKLQEDLKSGSKPTGVTTYGYVSGAMPTSQRTRELRALGELANEDRYIVGNARCLSEGVDVPALDGVAFVDPKRSEIDIVQAVGRAIRLAEGKSFGTIVIPVFISDSEDPDEILSTSEFDQVWKVVNALKSHDEALGETLDEMRVGLGRRSKVSLSGTKVIFDVPSNIDHRFIEAFETKLIETSTSSWEFGFGVFTDYVRQQGSAHVEAKGCTHNGFSLSTWCDTQRVNYRAGRLSADREERLNEYTPLGWNWSLADAQREQNIKDLEAYYKANGHSFCEEREVWHGIQVGVIRKSLRQAYENNKLEQKWIDHLEQKLEFIWEGETDYFFQKDLEAFADWSSEHQSGSPPRGTGYQASISRRVSRERDLTQFRSRCIKRYNYWFLNKHYSGAAPRKLTEADKNRIETIPYWSWNANDDRWRTHYRLVLQFESREGNPHIPANGHKETDPIDGKSYDVSRWLRKQRDRHAEGSLEAWKVKLLNEIADFEWSGSKAPKKKKFKLNEDDFEFRFDLLREFIAESGHAVVQQDVVYRGHKLGLWVSQWRSGYFAADGRKITQAQIDLLSGCHPTWMWSAADAREGIPYPLTDNQATELLAQRPDHEINIAIKLGLFAGLRLHDCVNFSVSELHNIPCFYFPERRGVKERFIPIGKQIDRPIRLTKSNQSLGIFYRRLEPFKHHTADQKVLFNALLMTWREKLISLQLDSALVNKLLGWNPDTKWSADQLNRAKEIIDNLDYYP